MHYELLPIQLYTVCPKNFKVDYISMATCASAAGCTGDMRLVYPASAAMGFGSQKWTLFMGSGSSSQLCPQPCLCARFTGSLFPSSCVDVWVMFRPFLGTRESIQVLEHCVCCLKISSPFLKERQQRKYKLPATQIQLAEHSWALPSFISLGCMSPRSLFPLLHLTSLSYRPHFVVFWFYTVTYKSIVHSCTNVARFFCSPLIILQRTFILLAT